MYLRFLRSFGTEFISGLPTDSGVGTASQKSDFPGKNVDMTQMRACSAATPGDQRPDALMDVVERALCENLGESDAAGDPCISGDQCCNHKGV